MGKFLKPQVKARVETNLSITAKIVEGSQDSVTVDLKFIAENLTPEELNIVRKVAGNSVIKTMALDYASRYI